MEDLSIMLKQLNFKVIIYIYILFFLRGALSSMCDSPLPHLILDILVSYVGLQENDWPMVIQLAS